MALLLVRSLAAYWLHRMFHTAPWLWRIHRVHHADTAIDCTTALRNHFVELPFATMLAVLVILALGPPMPIVAAVEAVLVMANFWQHAAIRLPESLARRLEWVVITPRLHLLHHAQARQDHDTNFGDVFSLWDRLFGTFGAPRSVPITVGLPDEGPGAQSLAHQLASPFRH
jgi:sterol desaturase/sphingolipid hydroxylase (fatty acid hydroxylase superfamily)